MESVVNLAASLWEAQFAFESFASISRLSREMIVTEKLDGTNAQVLIGPVEGVLSVEAPPPHVVVGDQFIVAGSRNRWISTQDDNFGFANWVAKNAAELVEKLGDGRHYGEWWGQGVQRGYGLKEKRFSLFNTTRWADQPLPAGVDLVPVLYTGDFCTEKVDEILFKLKTEGSVAAPGFMQPEGLVVFHAHSRMLFKKTLDKNDKHKWEA